MSAEAPVTMSAPPPPEDAAEQSEPYDRIRAFLDREQSSTPCLAIDLETVRQRYRALRTALPEAFVYYAVKANATADVIRLLADLGAGFDVASVAETELCVALGADPATISYTNTIKKRADIARAYALGVRRFTTDSRMDLEHLGALAPGATVWCRLLVEPPGSATPFGQKFGCSTDGATRLLRRAAELGLEPGGVTFHVGSQQLEPRAFDAGIGAAAAALADAGIHRPTVNLGGGFPAAYRRSVASLDEYAVAIRASLRRHFVEQPDLVIEPGRAIVAAAGVIRTEVVLVSRKCHDPDRRWVYVDVGRYGGLAETENEAIAYSIVAPRPGPSGLVCLAGPTADGDDVLYQRTPYHLPLDLRAGDRLDVLGAGAYTAAYAAPLFGGAGPLPVHVLPAGPE